MFLSECDYEDLTHEQIDKLLFSADLEKPVKSDYAILLGTAPEFAVVRARIAAEYFHAGGADRIVTTGGAVNDKTVTESAVMRAKLEQLGVPSDCIIDEPTAQDTVQNMTCSVTEICRRCNIYEVGTVAIISEPFHMRRALCLADMFLPRFIKAVGYTRDIAAQRDGWKTDDRLARCVRTEVDLLKYYISRKVIADIRI